MSFHKTIIFLLIFVYFKVTRCEIVVFFLISCLKKYLSCVCVKNSRPGLMICDDDDNSSDRQKNLFHQQFFFISGFLIFQRKFSLLNRKIVVVHGFFIFHNSHIHYMHVFSLTFFHTWTHQLNTHTQNYILIYIYIMTK